MKFHHHIYNGFEIMKKRIKGSVLKVEQKIFLTSNMPKVLKNEDFKFKYRKPEISNFKKFSEFIFKSYTSGHNL